MKRLLIALATVAGLAACSHEMIDKPTTAEEFPVEFTMSGLDSKPPQYKHGIDSATGIHVWTMRKSGGSKFAIVTYLEAHSDYAFSTRSPRSWVADMLPDDAKVEWQDSGSMNDGATVTSWQAFDLGGDARCIGLLRELKRHAEAGSQINATQTAIVAIYCRPGMAPLEAVEAQEVSSAIRLKT
ncbi:MAG: hypothetical protein U1E14_11210 [Geminicoccaceae bacterium]